MSNQTSQRAFSQRQLESWRISKTKFGTTFS